MISVFKGYETREPFTVDTANSKVNQSNSIEVIIFCLKKRFSGVTATIDNVLPLQAKMGRLAYVGPALPHTKKTSTNEDYLVMTFINALRISRKRLDDGRKRIWHVRRNKEMLLGILFRDLFKLPIHLVFTYASIKKKSAFPRWLISKMDLVLATSAHAAQHITSDCKIIPHGIDTDKFNLPLIPEDLRPHPSLQLLESKERAWKTSGLPGRFGIGIFGRVREEKGIHLFVDAMIKVLPAYPDFTAFIAGLCQASDHAYKQKLLVKIKDAGLSERIVFLGDIKPEEVALWYQRCLITVACPLYEGFGLTILESMACGCAAIASLTGAFDSMVLRGETGELIKLNDSDSLTSALKGLLPDPLKIVHMGLQGRQRVETLFPIMKEAQDIHQSYQWLWRKEAL